MSNLFLKHIKIWFKNRKFNFHWLPIHFFTIRCRLLWLQHHSSPVLTFLFRKKGTYVLFLYKQKKKINVNGFEIKLRFQISLTFHSLWHPVCRVGLYIRSVEERVKTADRLRVLNWKKVVCKYREAVTQVSSHCYIYYYTTHTTWTTQSTQMTI